MAKDTIQTFKDAEDCFKIKQELKKRGLATFGSYARCKERLQRFLDFEKQQEEEVEEKHVIVDLPMTDEKVIHLNDEDYESAETLLQFNEVEDVVNKYRHYLTERITTLESTYYIWKLAETKLLEKWIDEFPEMK
jgi:hypothetical protein